MLNTTIFESRISFYPHHISIQEINNTKFNELIEAKKLGLLINVSRQAKLVKSEDTFGYRMRRTAIDNSVPVITDIKWAKLFTKSLQLFVRNNREIWIDTSIDCMT